MWPRIQVTTPAQYLADFQRIYARLADDVAEHDIDDLAHTDWPRTDPQVVTQLVTIREQLECLLGRVVRWAQADDTQHLAQPLITAICDVLRPAFVAPPRTIRPPLAMHLAIERLKAAGALPITTDTLEQGGELGRDARLVWVWLGPLDDS